MARQQSLFPQQKTAAERDAPQLRLPGPHVAALLAEALRAPPRDIAGLIELRGALSGAPCRLASLFSLFSSEPGFQRRFFDELLPGLLAHAAALPERLPAGGLPLQLIERPARLDLDRSLAASLLAHLFLGTLPPQSADPPTPEDDEEADDEDLSDPDASDEEGEPDSAGPLHEDDLDEWADPLGFSLAPSRSPSRSRSSSSRSSRSWGGWQAPSDYPRTDWAPLLDTARPAELAKLRCILEGLAQIAALPAGPPGRLSIERRVLDPAPTVEEWTHADAPLQPLEVLQQGAIEEAQAHLQVDFANRYLGGGVLTGGSVQEEIRFAECPECLVAMLFCPVMKDGEAIWIRGAERFSRAQGYGRKLRWGAPFRDDAPRDPDGTPAVELVAIDARHFRGGCELVRQTRPDCMLRELNKAWVGFAAGGLDAVASGNWGCGVFHGHLALKACLQWLAASHAGRSLRYYAFGDARLGDLSGFAAAARARGATVGDLWRALLALSEHLADGPRIHGADSWLPVPGTDFLVSPYEWLLGALPEAPAAAPE